MCVKGGFYFGRQTQRIYFYLNGLDSRGCRMNDLGLLEREGISLVLFIKSWILVAPLAFCRSTIGGRGGGGGWPVSSSSLRLLVVAG